MSTVAGATGKGYGLGMTIGFGIHPPVVVAVVGVQVVTLGSPDPLKLKGTGKAIELKKPVGTDESLAW